MGRSLPVAWDVARSRRLLAQRLDHKVFRLAVAGLALAAGDEGLWRAFFGSVRVEALAFLVALALAEPVGPQLAIRRAIGGDRAGDAPGYHGRRLCHVAQIVQRLRRALDLWQYRDRFVPELSEFVDQPRILFARGRGRRLRLLLRLR